MLSKLTFTGMNRELVSVAISSILGLESGNDTQTVLRVSGGGRIAVREPLTVVRTALRFARKSQESPDLTPSSYSA